MKHKKEHLNYLRTDFKGELFFSFDYFKKKIMITIYSIYFRLKLKLQGVVIGKNCSFFKLPIFQRFPCSLIIIGDSCRFVSSNLGNYRGINHCCIVQTGTSIAKIVIGDRCGFSGVSIVCDNNVTIGNDVLVGANSIIGDRDDHSDLFGDKASPIHIGDNVWIGMNVVILKGVHIGNNSIIGAGSVLTKSVPCNEIWAGNPAKFIKRREDY